MERTLVLDSEELYFSAAHYMPDYNGLCEFFHGHTYFIKGLRLLVEGFVDLSDIKKVCKLYDHSTLIPKKHQTQWSILKVHLKKDPLLAPIARVFNRMVTMPDKDVPGTSVEVIAEELRKEFLKVPGVKEATFVLLEGPIAGSEV